MSVSANQDFQTPHRQPLRTNLPPIYKAARVAAAAIVQPQLSNLQGCCGRVKECGPQVVGSFLEGRFTSKWITSECPVNREQSRSHPICRLLGTHLGQLGINQLRRAAKARHDFLLGR
jgi:hypothetical protein